MTNITTEELLDSLFDGVYGVDEHQRITFWNKGAERITGYQKSEVMGSRCSDNILRHVDDEGHELCKAGCPLSATLCDGRAREVSVYLHHKLGHRVPVSVRVSPVRSAEGAVVGCVEIFADNSNFLQVLKELEQLKQDAYLDALTGVGNRRYGEMVLQTRLYEVKTFSTPCAVLFLDLDHFKQFNDTFGHKTGDEVLIMVGRTLINVVRRTNAISRWGGEEFVLLLRNVRAEALRQVAERIRVSIQHSFMMAGSERLGVTASIGATLALPNDTPESAIQRADGLMYASKAAGRNRVTQG